MRTPSPFERRLIRSAAGAASGRGSEGALLVLIFHRVLHEPDPLLPDEPDGRRFAAILDLLAGCFAPLPLREAVERLRAGTLPPRALCVTFDDGYANNLEVAAPLLLAKGVPATVFVAPGFLDGGRMFNDTLIETLRRAPARLDLGAEGFGCFELDGPAARRSAVDALLARLKYLGIEERLQRIERIAQIAGVTPPTDLMMTSAQLRELHGAGVEIGAHTVDHPILASVDDVTARRQIAASKAALEQLIDAPVRSFAYPNGRPQQDYVARHVAMARELGFDLALSTAWGAATRATDPFQIPRVAPWDRTPLRYGLRLARAYRQRSSATA